jgi:hypothetical protein
MVFDGKPLRRAGCAVALALALAPAHAQTPLAPPASTAPPVGETALAPATLPSAGADTATMAAAVAPVPSAASVPDPGPSAPSTGGEALAVQAVWQGDPIPVALKAGVERRIDFPEPIADLDIPQPASAVSRVVLSPAGSLHWLAREPFGAARVLATAVSGALYQLDVSARAEGATPERLVVRDPALEASVQAQTNAPTDPARLEAAAAALIPDFLRPAPPGASGHPPRASYAALARFALAHYSGPARLIPKLDATPMAVRPIAVRDWVRWPVAGLRIQPLRQWKAGKLHVTALGVDNHGSRPVPFEPKALRGRLLFAAALQPTLEPAGSGHHGTVWAVVTEQPFNQAVLPHAVPLVLNRP